MAGEKRRTVAQWVHELEAPDARLTLLELMALCLVHIRENVKDARLANERVEGIAATLDDVMALTNPVYAERAMKRGAMLPADLTNGRGS